MGNVTAEILHLSWRKADIKLAIDGDMHVIRWRRGWFVDEVLFNDRRVATAQGLFSRETAYGLDIDVEGERREKILLSIDATPDWNDMSGDMRPRGVRLDTADGALLAHGSLSGAPRDSFERLVESATKALGLSSS